MNPRIPESQPGALTTWLRSPYLHSYKYNTIIDLYYMKITTSFLCIYFNGELYSLQSFKLFTLDNLRTFFSYKKNLIVMEYNGRIIHPENWPCIILKNFDRIEILTIVGGG